MGSQLSYRMIDPVFINMDYAGARRGRSRRCGRRRGQLDLLRPVLHPKPGAHSRLSLRKNQWLAAVAFAQAITNSSRSISRRGRGAGQGSASFIAVARACTMSARSSAKSLHPSLKSERLFSLAPGSRSSGLLAFTEFYRA